mgnify:CR=1 FL=1
MTQAYPLHWPESWPRTTDRKSSQFKTTLSGALANVEKSLQLFSSDSKKAIKDVVISSNVTLGAQKPADPGVAIYFSWDGLNTCIAVDRYLKVEENLQAIHHCIEAERTKLRHGGLNLVRAAFRGYAALPPPSSAKEWWHVFGVHRAAPLAEVEKAYRTMARSAHPDNGGSADMMAGLNAAIQQARKEKSGQES